MIQINDRAISNKLPINEEKTKLLIVTGKHLQSKIDNLPTVELNGNPIKNVNTAKLLGLEFDNELSFGPHIDNNVCIKLSQRIGVLKKMKSYLPSRQRLLYIITVS